MSFFTMSFVCTRPDVHSTVTIQPMRYGMGERYRLSFSGVVLVEFVPTFFLIKYDFNFKKNKTKLRNRTSNNKMYVISVFYAISDDRAMFLFLYFDIVITICFFFLTI